MKNKNVWQLWLEQLPPTGGEVAPIVGPEAAPGTEAPGVPVGTDPNAIPGEEAAPTPPAGDVTTEPKEPELPEEAPATEFEEWRNEFFKLAVKGDVEAMLNHVELIRDSEQLDMTERRFVEDNLNVLHLRQDTNIEKAADEIRGAIKKGLDTNSPGVSMMTNVVAVLETVPVLNDAFQRLTGFYGQKADLYRKFIASLTGCVVVGGGATNEDIVYNEKDYSINFHTRFATTFGDISLGKWSLRVDSPEKYLSEPELSRLQEGSPEEKDALIHRIVVESIAERFKSKSFLIHVVTKEGAIYSMGWDIGESLLNGHKEGKLAVETRSSEYSEAMIDESGAIVPLVDLFIRYKRSSGEVGLPGEETVESLDFMERKNGILYLTASLETLKDLSTGMTGIYFNEKAYDGNPRTLVTLTRCVPSAYEMLIRHC